MRRTTEEKKEILRGFTNERIIEQLDFIAVGLRWNDSEEMKDEAMADLRLIKEELLERLSK